MRFFRMIGPAACCLVLAQGASAQTIPNGYESLVAQHAAANGLPASLVHRVIMRESRYNARAVSKGNYGIMQIRLGTARAMGYTGSAAGLLDPNTNMTYAVKYLAGAYRAAGGNPGRAVGLYASGYYYQAKAQGFSPYAAPSFAGSGFGTTSFAAPQVAAPAVVAPALAAPVRTASIGTPSLVSQADVPLQTVTPLGMQANEVAAVPTRRSSRVRAAAPANSLDAFNWGAPPRLTRAQRRALRVSAAPAY